MPLNQSQDRIRIHIDLPDVGDGQPKMLTAGIARALGADDRYDVVLAAILAQILAGRFGITRNIDEVVSGLEGLAKSVCEAGDAISGFSGITAEDSSHFSGRDEQCSSLQPVDVLRVGTPLRIAGNVVRLPGDQAVPTHRVRQQCYQLRTNAIIDVELGQQPERLVEERNRHQDRVRLSEDHMSCRSLSTRRGVVHARQIVEDKRGGVHHFHCGTNLKGRTFRLGVACRNQEQQDRTNPFPRGQQSVVDRVAEVIWLNR